MENFFAFAHYEDSSALKHYCTDYFKQWKPNKTWSYYDVGSDALDSMAFAELIVPDLVATIQYHETASGIYEEEMIVTQGSDNFEHLKGIRFYHDWYFDERTGLFYSNQVGFAPNIAVYDDTDMFRYWYPIYYVRMEE